MATQKSCAGYGLLDPVQGLIDYVNDTKPYHTKVVEVLVEYVYDEDVDITITDQSDFIIDIVHPETPVISNSCETGYNVTQFGGSAIRPVITPNPNIPLLTYWQQLEPNSFILSGDVTKEFKPGSPINFIDFVLDFEHLYEIQGNTVWYDVLNNNQAHDAVELNDPSSDFITHFAVGDQVEFLGTGNDNKVYTIVNISTAGTTTTVALNKTVLYPGTGLFGVKRTLGNNIQLSTSGSTPYVVQSVEYVGGTLDQWPGYPNFSPTDYILGDNPHTIVTVDGPLDFPTHANGDPIDYNFQDPENNPRQIYVAFAQLLPLNIKRVIPYSKHIVSKTADEGTNTRGVKGVTLSTIDLQGYAVPGTGMVQVDGNFEETTIRPFEFDTLGNIVVEGDKITIKESTDNNGTYSIMNITYDELSDRTTFAVKEKIDGPELDGYVEIYVPSNVFVVEGDYTHRYKQGTIFDVVSGSHSGQYTVLSARYVDGNTWIRPKETIVDGVGQTFDIIDITSGFVIRGDVSSQFDTGKEFTVTGSLFNDGTFTVDTVVPPPLPPQNSSLLTDEQNQAAKEAFFALYPNYWEDTFKTVITPYEEIEPLYRGGTIQVFQLGKINDRVLGFNEMSGLCTFDSDTVIAVQINERLVFSNIGIDARDDVIVYNLENTDGIPALLAGNTTQPGKGSIELVGEKVYVVGGSIENPQTVYSLHTITGNGDHQSSYNIPGSDKNLLRVFVNDIEVDYEFLAGSNFEFELSPPPDWKYGDNVRAEIYSYGTEYNAYLTTQNAYKGINLNPTIPFGQDPYVLYEPFDIYLNEVVPNQATQPGTHNFFHEYVTVTNGMYKIEGGNFSRRFTSDLKFDVYNSSGLIETRYANSFSVLAVDSQAGTIQIEQDITGMLEPGMYINYRFDSSRNYDQFLVTNVQSSVFVEVDTQGTYLKSDDIVYNTPATTITVDNPTIMDEWFWEPPLDIIEMQNVASGGVITIEHTDDISPDFLYGERVRIGGSSGQFNDGEYDVRSSSYDENTRILTIILVQDVITDLTGTGYLQRRNYAKNLGEVMGAFYQPTPTVPANYTDERATSNPSTYIVPTFWSTTPPDVSASAINYRWYGPLRMHIEMDFTNDVYSSISQRFTSSDELVRMVHQYEIIDTNSAANTFTVFYQDPFNPNPSPAVSGVDLTDSFLPGTQLRVAHSNSDGDETYTNDSMYVVASSTYLGNGQTEIFIETDYAQIPPAGTFTVIEARNNDTDLATITFAGDVRDKLHHNMLQQPGDTVRFLIDFPLVSYEPLHNMLTITNIELIGGNTVCTVDHEFIHVTYTGVDLQEQNLFVGTLNLIEDRYRGRVYFDDNTLAAPWTHGYVIEEQLGAHEEGLTQTQITDTLSFSWGSTYTFPIVAADATNRYFYVDGDYTSVFDPGETIRVFDSIANDGNYIIESVTFNPTLFRTIIQVDVAIMGGTLNLGTIELLDIDITNWFQYLITNADSTLNIFTVHGDATSKLQSNQEFKVQGTANDGIYTTVGAPIYNSVNNSTDISVASISNDEKGGWIESFRDSGMHVIFEDTIGVNITENATGALMLTAGNIMDAWDYNYFDVGSWDESLGTVVNLYDTNT